MKQPGVAVLQRVGVSSYELPDGASILKDPEAARRARRLIGKPPGHPEEYAFFVARDIISAISKG
jgi:hypothetical protein